MKRKQMRFRGLGLSIIVMMLLLSACNALPIEIELPWLNTQMPNLATPSPTPEKTAVAETDEPESTATPVEPVDSLILWFPPELSPLEDTPAGKILSEKIDAFSNEQAIDVEIRIKSQTGTGSLLDSLTASSLAAPHTSPDLIVLTTDDLRLAQERDLIFANGQLKEMLGEGDWYPFGEELAQMNIEFPVLPIMANPLVMVYRQDSLLPPSNDWKDISTNFGYFGFAADDPQAEYMLMLYQALGGKLMDAQGRAILEEEPLLAALTVLREGKGSLHISNLTSGFQTNDQVWTAYINRNIDTAVVPLSIVLNHNFEVNHPLPALTEPEITLGDSYGWALGNSNPIRQELALDLLEELSEANFLAEWTEALGWLPARSSALDKWENEGLKPVLLKLGEATKLYPPEEIVNRLGPALRNASLLILVDSADPLETTKTTIESIK